MDTSLEWKIVVGQRRFTSGYRMVGGAEEEDCNNHEKLSNGLNEKQKHGRRNGRSLAFGNGWTALGCINRNNNNLIN